MLQGLDDIPWDTLSHAYGPAGDVPDLLRQLTSQVEEDRQSALHELWGNVFHQGTRYQASQYAVPFLVEIVRTPGPRRTDIVALLLNLAVGYPEEWLASGFRADLVRQQQQELDDNEWNVDAIHVYDAVCREVKALISLLKDDDESVRVHAAHSLAFLPDVAHESVPQLIATVGLDQSKLVRASALLALGLVHQNAPFDVEDVSAGVADDGDQLVRFSVAALDGRPDGDHELSQETIHVLTDALAHERMSADVFPWNEGDISGFAGVILGRWPLDDSTLDRMCVILRTAGPVQSVTLARVLLSQTFPRGRADVPELAANLSKRQSTIVRALEHAGGWRIGDSIFGNFSLLLTGFGLRGDAESIGRWLAGADLESCRPAGFRAKKSTLPDTVSRLARRRWWRRSNSPSL